MILRVARHFVLRIRRLEVLLGRHHPTVPLRCHGGVCHHFSSAELGGHGTMHVQRVHAGAACDAAPVQRPSHALRGRVLPCVPHYPVFVAMCCASVGVAGCDCYGGQWNLPRRHFQRSESQYCLSVCAEPRSTAARTRVSDCSLVVLRYSPFALCALLLAVDRAKPLLLRVFQSRSCSGRCFGLGAEIRVAEGGTDGVSQLRFEESLNGLL